MPSDIGQVVKTWKITKIPQGIPNEGRVIDITDIVGEEKYRE